MRNLIQILIVFSITVFFTNCGKAEYQISEDFDISTGAHSFSSDLLLIYSETAPGLKMRPSGIENVKYNVASWNSISDEDLMKQVKRDAAQQGDGFDDEILEGKTDDRTANLFYSGINIALKANHVSQKGDTAFIYYATNEYAEVSAKVYYEDGHLCFESTLTPLKKGYFSLGYMNAPANDIEKVEEIWQAMIWQEMRFPDRSYMTLAYRTPIPSALATIDNTTYGIVAHPDEFPFDPLPLYNNSRFGVAVRNAKGQVQPMLFAPVLGGIDSKRAVGEVHSFRTILYAHEGNCTDSYEIIARQLFNFDDYRHNDIATLNSTFENIVDYSLSDYAWFIDSLKGCAYSTDVPSAVKNVSSLNPLELAIVTDNSEMFTQRSYPTMEYQISREKFLFCLDKEQKIQHPSRKLTGPIAPVSELTSLYNVFGKNMPFLLELARNSYSDSKIRNLDVKEAGDSWMNNMFMYESTKDESYLAKAKQGADEYLKERVNTPQVDYNDPLAGGFFFWTGYAPRWIYLLELYEITQEKKYLEAAQQGARYYTMFCWMSPKIPQGNITVNKGGKAPLYGYLKSKGHHQMYADEEEAPAWRLSEIGLTPESSGTCTGHRAIFMANYAPWMLRLGYYAKDVFLQEVAKAAIIGRYRNFPGYHINTARTTIYEKANYPLQPHKDLSVNSFHYNHIMPMASMLLDYLVTDAFVKSDAAIDFPSEFIEGYAYLQNKFYGHKAGDWYGEKVWLWMPSKLIETGSVELNNITARGDNSLYIALNNQSKREVTTWVKVNPASVTMSEATDISQNGKKVKLNNGKFEVTVPASGQVAIKITDVELNVGVQKQLLASPTKWENDFVSLPTGNAKAMIIHSGNLGSKLYLYLEDDDDVYSQVELIIKEKGNLSSFKDTSYPYEFTIPVNDDKIEFQIIAKQGKKKTTSDWFILNK